MMKKKEVLTPVRIGAIDALRGFDMFWITGGLALVIAGIKLFVNPMPAWLGYHLAHVNWEGFAAWDLVMPLFLFIVGASMPFSFDKEKLGDMPRYCIYSKIFKRVIILCLFGMMVQGNLLSFKVSQMVLLSNTLQAIAGGYLIAAICLLNFSVRQQVGVIMALLVSYWLILRAIPSPDGGGHWSQGSNIAFWVEKALLGDWRDKGGYAWLLPQLGFGASVLLGVCAGHILKSREAIATPKAKLACLVGAGALCLLLGYLASYDLPLIKKLWTSSMVLWSSGWCFLLIALFYFLCDCCRLEKWFFPLKVIGSNAIFAYMWVNICSPEHSISRALFGGFSHLFGSAGQFVFLLCNYALVWTILYILYKKKIFLKV